MRGSALVIDWLMPSAAVMKLLNLRIRSGKKPVYVDDAGVLRWQDPSLYMRGPGASVVSRDYFLEHLARAGWVGSVDLASVGERDEPRAILYDPSDYVMRADIFHFCEASGRDIADFVLRLKFGLLDQ